MKRQIIILFFSLIATTGFAQKIGVKAGPTYSSFKGDQAEGYEHKLGYTFGFMTQHHLTEKIGIQTEALYTSKGAKNEFRSGNQDIKETLRLNYIEVPVLLHVYTGGIFFDLGPQISFISKSKQIREVNSGDTENVVKTDITDLPYAIDFNYVAGVGYRASNGLGAELRYTGGVKNIFDEGPMVGRELRNSSFSFMLSYFLR
jgi:hypothetical protein